jgi:hypothetical protein
MPTTEQGRQSFRLVILFFPEHSPPSITQTLRVERFLPSFFPSFCTYPSTLSSSLSFSPSVHTLVPLSHTTTPYILDPTFVFRYFPLSLPLSDPGLLMFTSLFLLLLFFRTFRIVLSFRTAHRLGSFPSGSLSE